MWASSLKHFPVYVAEGVDACGLYCPGSLASQFSVTFCPVEVLGEMEEGGMKGETLNYFSTFKSALGAGGGAVTWRLLHFLCAPPSRFQLAPSNPGFWALHTPSASPGPPPLGGGRFHGG